MVVLVAVIIAFLAGWFGRPLSGPVLQRLPDRSGQAGQAEKPAIHTAKGDAGWDVAREVSPRTLAHFDTNAEAESAGRARARREETDHVVHRVDGSVSDVKHYGETSSPGFARKSHMLPSDSNETPTCGKKLSAFVLVPSAHRLQPLTRSPSSA